MTSSLISEKEPQCIWWTGWAFGVRRGFNVAHAREPVVKQVARSCTVCCCRHPDGSTCARFTPSYTPPTMISIKIANDKHKSYSEVAKHQQVDRNGDKCARNDRDGRPRQREPIVVRFVVHNRTETIYADQQDRLIKRVVQRQVRAAHPDQLSDRHVDERKQHRERRNQRQRQYRTVQSPQPNGQCVVTVSENRSTIPDKLIQNGRIGR